MSNFQNIELVENHPLEGLEYSSVAGPQVTMAPTIDCRRLSLRIDPKDLEQASQAFGLGIPKTLGEMSSKDGRHALCLGPDDWLLMVQENDAGEVFKRFSSLNGSVLHSLVDVSHRTVGIEISGPGAALMINCGCPLDLDKFEIGACTRTVLDKIEIILMRHERDVFQLEIVRSFAPYAWAFLLQAGEDVATF